MARAVATIAAVLIGAQGFVPLALACCVAPAAHACCPKAKAEVPGLSRLGRAPCCRPAPAPLAARHEQRLSPERSSSAPLAVVRPVHATVRDASLTPSRVQLSGAARAPGPPLPLRI